MSRFVPMGLGVILTVLLWPRWAGRCYNCLALTSPGWALLVLTAEYRAWFCWAGREWGNKK